VTDVSGVGWRDAEPDQFAATVLAAAEQLGVLPLAVEKDYWACRALRAITIDHPDEVVFKGGTSLEKLRIIRRFSEDLDLLVVGAYPSANAAKNALQTMMRSAVEATGGEPSDVRSGGKQGSYWRRGYLAPALTHSSAVGAIADASAILLELGQSGGPHPSSDRPVQSLLARQLDQSGFDTAAWSDLATFDVAILHPGRTLIEKLLRVNNFASDPAAQETTHGWPRIGRQFYDIWALLGAEEVLDLLADTRLAGEILASCYEVSKAFTPDRLVPAGGFAASTAFVPDGPLAQRLGAEHDVAMRDLYYGTDEPPSFGDVLDRVQANRQLLDIETQR
jgi:hypothetical protein